MGYCTSYKIEIKDDFSGESLRELRETSKSAEYALDENGGCREECKWYDHEKDMMSFSMKKPDELFILSGEGEDSDDLWVKYFKGGKMQEVKAKITYAPFDPKLLK